MQTLGTDLKQSLRSLFQAPVFTLVVVLSLALGIGANTAIFTFADQLLLRLLPVAKPKELVQLNVAGGRIGSSYGRYGFSYPMYRDLRDRNTVFTGVVASYSHPASIRLTSEAEMLQAEMVSGNYFQVLGVGAAAGRLFTQDDDRNIGAHPLAVLSHKFWKDRYSGDRDAIGKTIYINNHAFTIAGVSSEGFDGLDVGASPAVRVPLAMKRVMTPTWDAMEERETHWIQLFGRLKAGVSVEHARSMLDSLRRSIAEQEVNGEWWSKAPAEARSFYIKQSFELLPAAKGQSFLRRQYELPLKVLMAIVGVVLLIACANVASLMLARAAQRQKEIAVRFSLGATRAQVARRLLMESLLLASMGGAAGTLVSIWGCDSLLRYVQASGQSALTLSTAPDLRVLLFTAALSVLTGVAFGIAPAWQASGVDLADSMKNQAGSVSLGRGHVRLRQMLVGAQIALSALLLCCAGLFLKSLTNLHGVDPGVDVNRVILFSMDPTMSGYKPEQTIPLYSELYRRIAETPGVVAVSGGGNRVLSGDDWHWTIRPEGWASSKSDNGNVLFNPVGPGYFNALGVRMLAGRDFLPSDSPKRKVAVVNEAFAKRFFGGANPVGRRFATDIGDNPVYDVEIVGMAADAKYVSLREDNEAQMFMPYMTWPERTGRLNIVVRFQGDGAAMQQEIRRAVHGYDPNIPIYRMATMSEQVDRSLSNENLVALLAGAFGALATLLAAIGLYGVLAFQVARRGREIGIRVAMGANTGSIVGLVVREVLILLVLGGAAGISAGLSLTHLVQSQLYGLSPQDPSVFTAAAVLLAMVAALAAAVPAWRAAKTDPLRALRYE